MQWKQFTEADTHTRIKIGNEKLHQGQSQIVFLLGIIFCKISNLNLLLFIFYPSHESFINFYIRTKNMNTIC